MRLLAVMPVKDELARHLPSVLDHLGGIADGIFVYDDRSSDGTPDFLRSQGISCAVRPSEVAGFVEHEGQFRQWGYDQFVETMKPEPGDWILAQDADEKLYGTRHLPDLMQQSRFDVLGISFVHMWNETQYRVDKAWAPTISSRLFRYQADGCFAQRKLACGSEPTYVADAIAAGRMLWETGLVFQHLGYSWPGDKAVKYARYSTIDKGDYHALAHIESILDPDPLLVDWVVPV